MEPLTIAALALAPSLAVFLAGCVLAMLRLVRNRGRHDSPGRSAIAVDR